VFVGISVLSCVVLATVVCCVFVGISVLSCVVLATVVCCVFVGISVLSCVVLATVVCCILATVVCCVFVGISVLSCVVLVYLPHIVSVIPLQYEMTYVSGPHCVHGLHCGVFARSPVMNVFGSHGTQSLQYVSVVAVHVADALLLSAHTLHG